MKSQEVEEFDPKRGGHCRVQGKGYLLLRGGKHCTQRGTRGVQGWESKERRWGEGQPRSQMESITVNQRQLEGGLSHRGNRKLKEL